MGRRKSRRSAVDAPRSIPGPHVVRVETEGWTDRHSELLEQLVEVAKQVWTSCEGDTFEEKKQSFSSKNFAVPYNGLNVFILFGPNTVFLEDGELQADIRGLLFKPILRKERDKVFVELYS